MLLELSFSLFNSCFLELCGAVSAEHVPLHRAPPACSYAPQLQGKGVKNPFKRPVLTNVFDRLLLFLLQVSKIGSISV